MRLNALLLGATALLSLALAAPAPAPIDYAFGDIHNPNLPHLTSATFTSSISHGMWCVTMLPLAFSVARSSSGPSRHTQARRVLLALLSALPAVCAIWQDVLEMQEHLATDSDFHMSRVNCIEQGGAWACPCPRPYFARHRHD